jgi:hypothetical protein
VQINTATHGYRRSAAVTAHLCAVVATALVQPLQQAVVLRLDGSHHPQTEGSRRWGLERQAARRQLVRIRGHGRTCMHGHREKKGAKPGVQVGRVKGEEGLQTQQVQSSSAELALV